jgi:hypothetical protein
MAQRRGTVAILAVAAVFLLVAGIGAYAQYAVLGEAAFADRAASTLHSDEVRQEIGARMGTRLVIERPQLAAGEGVLQDAVAEGVAAGPAFQRAFRGGAARMHRVLVSDPDAEASLRVEGSGAALRAELQKRLPFAVPRMADVPLLTVGQGARERALRRLAPPAHDLARPLTIGFALAGALLLALALARGPDRRRAAWGAGLAVAAAGGLMAACVTAAEDVVLDNFDTGYGDAVVGTVWGAYLGDLRLWALAVCAAGLVVAAAAGGPRPSPATLLSAPASRGGRALRAAGLLVVAGLAVQIPELVLHTGLVALAAALFYVAAGDILRVLAPPRSYGRRARLAAGAGAMLALIAVGAVVPI